MVLNTKSVITKPFLTDIFLKSFQSYAGFFIFPAHLPLPLQSWGFFITMFNSKLYF